MKNFDLPICKNPLKTKQDLQQAFTQLTDPLISHYSRGFAHLHIGNTSASYSDEIAGLEGFSRILWALPALTAGGQDSKLWELYITGIKNGTNPLHQEYWGEVNDYDQRLVEMAAMGLALILAPEKVWEPLSVVEKENFTNWLSQINTHGLYDCNWVLFAVMVNLGLKQVGAPFDKDRMDWALDKIEDFYIGDGWYSDGKGGHSDYYVPFAIHYYGLIYAKLMQQEDPKRSKLYKDRAATFAKDFIYWFDQDGSALPYGRSLTYRFAQSAFWSALVYAEVEVLPLGVVKGIILRNLRWWFSKPIFNADGTLTIGYGYPNLVMAENYNSPGSPYWSFKTFLILAFEDQHPFWRTEELPLPKLDKVHVQQKPHLVICRNDEGLNVMAFNTGHLSTNEHTHTSAKYEKFVYSNAFGFSVPRAEWGIAQGAFDSMLALSEQDNIYRVKRVCQQYSIEDNIIYTKWKPWTDVDVQTWLICGNPWHIRIHCIDTARSLNTAEGGFAIGLEHTQMEAINGESRVLEEEAYMKNIYGTSGIVNLYGERKSLMSYPNSNTNIMYPRTAIPTLTAQLEKGKHYLISAVLGSLDDMSFEQLEKTKPSIEVKDNKLYVFAQDKTKAIFSKAL